MSKKLVAYFSTSGVTARLAKTMAEAAGADLFEIEPAARYSAADLNWQNSSSRSSVEMNDPAARPAIAGTVSNMAQYDTVFIGFPIWWYVAPRIVQTFLEQYDLTGKTIVPFATSGGSGMGKTADVLQKSCPGATVLPGKRFSASASKDELTGWIAGLHV